MLGSGDAPADRKFPCLFLMAIWGMGDVGHLFSNAMN
jgi:hypothetical protein